MQTPAPTLSEVRPVEVDLGAMTQMQFCERYNVSRKALYDMRCDGTGPDVLKIGRAVRITYRAAAEWEARMIERSRNAKADAA